MNESGGRNKPLLPVLLAGAVLLLTALGWHWLRLPFSNQELLANYAKAFDYWRGLLETGRWPWWTPNFLGGTSLAPYIGTFFTQAWMMLWAWPFGPLAGGRIASLLAVGLGAVATYFCIRALSGKRGAALACGFAFLLLPSLWVRLGFVEHFVVVCSFALLPLVFWAVDAFFAKKSPASALALAAAASGLALTYSKIALLSAPLLVCFATWCMIRHHEGGLPPLRCWGILFAGLFLLGILPNLPALRESGFAVLFSLSPFEAWQQTFTTKSGILWLDRAGVLTHGMPPTFAPSTAQGGQYLGLVAITALALVFLLRRRILDSSPHARLFRIFLALTLLAHWFSYGKQSIFRGHLIFLDQSFYVSHLSIAIAWYVLILQGWIIFQLVPRGLPWRNAIAVLLIGIYFFVPGFLSICWLPIYDNIRAPFDFYQVTGAFCAAMAAGLAVFLLIEKISVPSWKAAIVTLCLAAAVWDLLPTWKPILNPRLTAEVEENFAEAQTFLRENPQPGSVYAVSGRYFYLLTPSLSGRPLVNEAFNLYLAQRPYAELQAVISSSTASFRNGLRICGVAFILIDRHDPDTPLDMQQTLRQIFPVAFENRHFVILSVPDPLGPAFGGHAFATTTSQDPATALASLQLAEEGIATILPQNHTAPWLERAAAWIRDGKIEHAKKSNEPPGFHPASLEGSLSDVYRQAVVTPPPGVEWLTLAQAWHPDWKAYDTQGPLAVFPAFNGLVAVRPRTEGAPVTFSFEPPFYYPWALTVSAVCWVLLVPAGFLLRSRSKNRVAVANSVTSSAAPMTVQRPLVIIPTYNERDCIETTLAQTLEADPRLEVLIVDDASPDGTADLIQSHPQYDKRVHLLRRSGKLGLASAYKEGFKWAETRGYDVCVEMDADLSHDPDDIPRLLKALEEGADAAIGSRYIGGVRVMNWPLDRLFLSTGASRYIRLLTGTPLHDPTSGFKAVRTSVLQKLDWTKFRAEGYGFQIELHHYLWKSGHHLVEVPIVFTERRNGQTKMSLFISIEAFLRVISLALEGDNPSRNS